MHPHTRILFDDWMRKLDKHRFITYENSFEMRTTMYDAMSACWKYFTVDTRHQVLRKVENFTGTCCRMKIYGKREYYLSC